jgi:hypothetical protein
MGEHLYILLFYFSSILLGAYYRMLLRILPGVDAGYTVTCSRVPKRGTSGAPNIRYREWHMY